MSNCPQCQSEQTSSFRMLWMSGTASGNLSGMSVTAGGNVGVFGGSSSQQTVLAQSVAPPSPPPFRGFLFGCLMPLLLWAVLTPAFNTIYFKLQRALPQVMQIFPPHHLLLLGIAVLDVVIPLVLRALYLRWRKQRLAPVLQIWENSWLCLKCGVRWVV